jgi:CobQ-like glutamine amidotransferase family enzyme
MESNNIKEEFNNYFEKEKCVLVLCGGMGFIGKNLLEYILENGVFFKRVYILDKRIAEMSGMGEYLLGELRKKEMILSR